MKQKESTKAIVENQVAIVISHDRVFHEEIKHFKSCSA